MGSSLYVSEKRNRRVRHSRTFRSSWLWVEGENWMGKERFLVNKVKSQICSVKQSLIGLHKGVMSLCTLHKLEG